MLVWFISDSCENHMLRDSVCSFYMIDTLLKTDWYKIQGCNCVNGLLKFLVIQVYFLTERERTLFGVIPTADRMLWH